MKGYPIFLIGLDQRSCIVVGGDREAERKVSGLLECEARVTLIAPIVTSGLLRLAIQDKLTWIPRDYRVGDLRGAWLVIASGQDEPTRDMICREARSENSLTNVMDDTAHCNFVAGSVLRRGPLTVSISTSGCAPALAVRLRQRLERELGAEYGELLTLLGSLRKRVARRHEDFDSRRELWYRIVDSDVLERIKRGDTEGAHRLALKLIGSPPASATA